MTTLHHFSRLLFTGAVLVLAGSFSGCASLKVRQAESSLPIVSESANWTSVKTSAWESSDHLYVSGSLRKGHGWHYHGGSSVRVDLVDETGVTIGSMDDDLPAQSLGRIGLGGKRIPFVVKFPLEQARQAAGIRMEVLGRDETL